MKPNMEREIESNAADKDKDNEFASENVDFTFLYRHKVSGLLDQLVNNKRNYKQRDRIIKEIFGMGQYAVPVIIERLKSAEASEASVLSQLLMLLEVEVVGIEEELFDLAFDPSVPDKNKNYILKVLEHCGLEPDDLPRDKIFDDPEKALEDAREALFIEMSQNIEAMPQFLTELPDLLPEAQCSLVRDMVNLNDEKVVVLLKVIAQLDESNLVEEAIKGLGKIKTSKSLGVLKELLNTEDRKKFYPLLKEEIDNLRKSGIIEPENGDGEDFKVGEMYKAAVSKIDGRGNQAVWLAFRWGKDKGGVCVLNFLCNIDDGLKDCWGIYRVTIKEFKNIMSEFGMDNSLIGNEPCYAKALLKDAINKNHANGSKKPMEFAFWRNFLDEDWFRGEPYEPELEKHYRIFGFKDRKRSRKDLGKLHDYKDFRDWLIHQPYVYDLASEILFVSKKHNKVALLSSSTKAEEIYEKFVDNLIKPRIDFYRRGLRMMADFELRKGRKKLFRLIMDTLYYLEEKGEIETHPFIEDIVYKSLVMVTKNLKYGFDMRLNPEDFES